MANVLVDKIRNLVAPPTEAAGYELVDLEWKHETGGWILRLFIDKPGGVGHADCERVSRELSAVLDVHEAISHHYSLEVSSPGLNRPLRTAAHFRKYVGELAKVRLKLGIDGRRNYTGTIVGVSDDGVKVVLEVDGNEVALPVDDVEKANLEFRFEK